MRKINKDFTNIPESLKPAISYFFSDGNYPDACKKTHSKRMDVINNNRYPSSNSNFDNRYKAIDVKQRLNDIYHNKCGFCEQILEQFQVEHYRPKKAKNNGVGQHHNGYYWLAFSWDNLLVACPKCNKKKDTHFDIDGIRVSFQNTTRNIKNINTLSAEYDMTELPKMVNPEKDDPENFIAFEKNGQILSTNDRYIYTIDKCNLRRSYLCDYRRKILDDFERKARSRFVEYTANKNMLEESIKQLINDFIEDTNNIENEYIAFRKYAIKNGWLNDIIKSIRI